MSEGTAPPVSAGFPFVPFLKAYWLRIVLLFLALGCIVFFALHPNEAGLFIGFPIGLIRGLTAYRPFISGKSFGELVSNERYNRAVQREYNRQTGSISLGSIPMPGTDHLNALAFWILGRLIRLMIVAIVWPLLETFFQLRFLFPAIRDARKNGMPA